MIMTWFIYLYVGGGVDEGGGGEDSIWRGAHNLVYSSEENINTLNHLE